MHDLIGFTSRWHPACTLLGICYFKSCRPISTATKHKHKRIQRMIVVSLTTGDANSLRWGKHNEAMTMFHTPRFTQTERGQSLPGLYTIGNSMPWVRI
jgi:hypothetical protein